MSSDSLRAATNRYREHNDKLSPPTTPTDRVRKNLVLARGHLNHVQHLLEAGQMIGSVHGAAIAELHAAVSSMLAALEAKS